MTDQMGTPGSTADTSINGGSKGGSAPKDKACPFCQQQFTSSSLGRHLDLYIKEKNPKPADGIHNVDEIRKMRGGITRRQPRNSTSRREGSTPAGTPGAHDRRSPRPESTRGDRSPSARREDIGSSNLMYSGKPRMVLNKATWEATGVMNNIPAVRNSDSRSWDGEDRDGRRPDGRNRSVSKQVLAKTTFDQKQKMMEALDNAKAAELALRELLGSIRAAKQRIGGSQIFDYDPLTLDFPALCLHCLPPPPTLHASTPIPNPQSWTIAPPDDPQYDALRAHFSSAFHNHRNSLAIATITPHDDLSYPPPSQHTLSAYEDPASVTARAEADATELESKISDHLHAVFAAWTSHSLPKRTEIWTLELARSVGRKSSEIKTLKKEKELTQQENAHLKLQNEELSRLQQPREFRLVPPQTVPFGEELMNQLGDIALHANKTVGFTVLDRNLHLDTLIERAIGRWKDVVREARGGGTQPGQGGMAAQRSLSGESLITPEHGTHLNVNSNSNCSLSPNHTANHMNPNPNSNREVPPITNGIDSIGSDQDADADADMEEDDSYVEMTDINHGQRAPEAPMAQSGQGFRLTNGNVAGQKPGGTNSGMEGIENQVVQGYVRIGA